MLAEQATLLSAVESAEENDRTAQAARERADRERHLAEANKIAAAALKMSEQIDTTMSVYGACSNAAPSCCPNLAVPVVSRIF